MAPESIGESSLQSVPSGQGSRLPVWARLVIALVISSLLGLSYAAIRFADVVQSTARDAFDPKKISEVANEIFQLPVPLPAGYTYDSALNFPGPTVKIWHEPDKQLIECFCDRNSAESDPKQVLDQAIDLHEKGLPHKIHSLKSRGKTTVCGQEMPYIVGEFYDEQNRSVEGMTGCICIKEKHKTIYIYALEPYGTPYNLQITMNLLNSIKGF